MKLKALTNATVIVLLLVSPRYVEAFEFLTSRGLGMGGTIVISEPSASTLLLLPSSEMQEHEWFIEVGLAREFELSELDRGYLAASTKIKDYTIALGLAQLGQRDFYAERTLKASIAYYRRQLSFNLNLSAVQYYFGGYYESLNAATFGIGATYKFRRVYAALSADNLTSPHLTDNSPAVEPQFSLYGELKGRGAFSLTGRLTFQKNEETQLAVGQKIDASEKGIIFWGLSTEPFQFGGGVDIRYERHGTITYAGSYHPTLGFSHNLSIIYRFGKTRQTDSEFE